MKCRWQQCLACIHPHQPSPLMDHSIQCVRSIQLKDSAHSWSYSLKRATTAKSTSRDGGRRRQEPDEPWFKRKFSLAILGSCGTVGFVARTFGSHVRDPVTWPGWHPMYLTQLLPSGVFLKALSAFPLYV